MAPLGPSALPAEAEDRRADARRKIYPLGELARVARALRARGLRLVLCHGTFDLLHIGHIRHLQRARREGDVLLVTVTADAHVNKGPGRPVFTEGLRAENLAALECVDYVAVNHAPTAVNVIEALRPHVYAKGSDYRDAARDVTGAIVQERAAVEAAGGRILFTDELTSSSTRLLNEHFGVFEPRVRAYLDRLRARHEPEAVDRALEGLRGLRVLVVGDCIVDEYHYTTPLGQTGKGYALAVRYEGEERFAGGAVAVANHLAELAGSVTLVTGLGGRDSHEAFLRASLGERVEPVFFVHPERATLVKRRYVGEDLGKLFEVYLGGGPLTEGAVGRAVAAWLERHLAGYDAVVVPDFGNGFVNPQMVALLCERAPFLAVNAQLNSGNRGFHAVTRYRRADFVALNEPELRLACADPASPVETLAESLRRRLGARQVAVTRGARGLWMADGGEGLAVPALATQVVDRIGAGDAFLAVASLALAGGLPAELAAFLGAAAAALDVQIVCNREPVRRAALRKFVGTLLK